MARVHPFRALRFAANEQSNLIAPPYDVLDAKSKATLLARNTNNIVGCDLPHTPAKELGPPDVYQAAADRLHSLLSSQILNMDAAPRLYPYRQTTRTGGTSVQRCGVAACVDLLPLGARQGGGILPHEETFSGPKQDRLALMEATKTQLSPIFGLYADEHGDGTAVIREVMDSRPPEVVATMADGVLHEVWTVSDAKIIAAFQAALAQEDIFIADGHHRYSTALTYLANLESRGTVPADHPARRCMMVLVGMSDPGLEIWPTHRVLGGMRDYSIGGFLKAAQSYIDVQPVEGNLAHLAKRVKEDASRGPMRFGLYDFATRQGYVASPSTSDPMAEQFPEKPAAWRELVVAYIQYVLVERCAQPHLNGGDKISWAFPHTIDEVEAIGQGTETGAGGGSGFAQLAVLVRPTPLAAVRDVSRAGVLMPQKSTFFYPKLATGLFMHPLT